MGASCCEDCKSLISKEKTNEFLEENENEDGNIQIPSEKKVSFSEFNPKKLEKKKTFTENFFGLFEHEKERKSNLKSPSHKNIKKHISKNLINDQLGPNSDFKISNIVNKNSSPKFSDLINNKENNNINYNINYNINNYVNNIPLNKEIEKKEEINKKEGKFEEDKNIIIEKKEDEDIKNDENKEIVENKE